MPGDTNRQSIGIKSLMQQLIKRYLVYDGLERLTTMYEAVTEAKDGEECLVTYYEYASPTSFKVTKIREDRAQWDITWDAA